MAGQWNDKRPMAPHLQIWRWHPAMLSSILHRACAIFSYAALIKVALGLLFLAKNGELPMTDLLYSPLGAIGLFIGIFAVVFMALAQLRHTVWDMGKMFAPDTNNTLSWAMIASALLTAALFTYAATQGGGA